MEAIDDVNHLEKKKTSARVDGTLQNTNITTALQVLLLDLTGSRGENNLPFSHPDLDTYKAV